MGPGRTIGGRRASAASTNSVRPCSRSPPCAKVPGGRRLDLHEADPGNDGGGDHARPMPPSDRSTRRKTDGNDIHVGHLGDQLAAKHVGHLTRFRRSNSPAIPSARPDTANRLFLRLPIQYFLAVADHADDAGTQSAARLRAPLRLRPAGGAPAQLRGEAAHPAVAAGFRPRRRASLEGQLGRRDRTSWTSTSPAVREIEERLQHASGFGPLPQPARMRRRHSIRTTVSIST